MFPSIWRYLVRILNRICIWSCGEGFFVGVSCLTLDVWLRELECQNQSLLFASFLLWRNLSLFQLNLSLVCDVYFWLAVVISWVLVERHSREKLSLHAALERFWIHSNAGSIVSFAVSFTFTWFDGDLDLNILAFNSNKFKLHSPEMFPLNLQSQLPNLSPSSIQSDKWQWVNDNVYLRLFSSRLVDNMERTWKDDFFNILLIIVRCSDFLDFKHKLFNSFGT